MARRIPRVRRLVVEQCERRELLSVYTDIMAANSLAAAGRPQSASTSQAISSALSQALDDGFAPSTSSIATAANQGPPPIGTNLALTPTGTLTPREIRREGFSAQFSGTYTIGAGRTSTEALQTFIAAAGTANTMRHCDIQLLIVTPKDPNAQIGGVCAIFDRNLNSNTVLGLDLLAPQQNVDSAGRPNRFTQVSLDVNISAGLYDGGYAQGVMNIRYIPSSTHTRGVISQGSVIVTIHAQVYTSNTAFILRNANIDP
ncbi:MAG: hypothetical protein ACLQVF_44000 [Isosphaeraceae bacterium]